MTEKVGDGDRKVGLDRGTLAIPDHTATMCHCEPDVDRAAISPCPGGLGGECHGLRRLVG